MELAAHVPDPVELRQQRANDDQDRPHHDCAENALGCDDYVVTPAKAGVQLLELSGLRPTPESREVQLAVDDPGPPPP
jgi:hypothetical protein